jgi:hypothetical protein
MLAHPMVKIRTYQEQVKANQAKMEANNKKSGTLQGTLLSWMEAHQAKIEACCEEWMATTKACAEELEAVVDVFRERLGKMNATEFGTSKETESEHEEACDEEATGKNVETWEDLCVDQWQTVGSSNPLKRWTADSVVQGTSKKHILKSRL